MKTFKPLFRQSCHCYVLYSEISVTALSSFARIAVKHTSVDLLIIASYLYGKSCNLRINMACLISEARMKPMLFRRSSECSKLFTKTFSQILISIYLGITGWHFSITALHCSTGEFLYFKFSRMIQIHATSKKSGFLMSQKGIQT